MATAAAWAVWARVVADGAKGWAAAAGWAAVAAARVARAAARVWAAAAAREAVVATVVKAVVRAATAAKAATAEAAWVPSPVGTVGAAAVGRLASSRVPGHREGGRGRA
jgi:hypothetical protein